MTTRKAVIRWADEVREVSLQRNCRTLTLSVAIRDVLDDWDIQTVLRATNRAAHRAANSCYSAILPIVLVAKLCDPPNAAEARDEGYPIIDNPDILETLDATGMNLTWPQERQVQLHGICDVPRITCNCNLPVTRCTCKERLQCCCNVPECCCNQLILDGYLNIRWKILIHNDEETGISVQFI